jgi:hypothetical protein
MPRVGFELTTPSVRAGEDSSCRRPHGPVNLTNPFKSVIGNAFQHLIQLPGSQKYCTFINAFFTSVV